MLYELSVPYYPGMPRYDETIPDVEFLPRTRTPGDVNNTTTVRLFMHAGSHVDAPFHFDGHGCTIEQIPIERFFYRKAMVVKIPCQRSDRVTAEQLREAPGLAEADLLLLYTGYSRYVSNERIYADDFPALDLSAARYLRRECPSLQAVAIDTLSIEGADGCDHGFAVHHELLDEEGRAERSLLVFENMNFEAVANTPGFFQVYAFPLRFPGLDASPVNMVAKI